MKKTYFTKANRIHNKLGDQLTSIEHLIHDIRSEYDSKSYEWQESVHGKNMMDFLNKLNRAFEDLVDVRFTLSQVRKD
ncbi:TPA: hypothetical protein ACKRFB_002857 [Proteus mirabilis]|nr:hypothetical protein [Proteus mirabilis]